MKSMSSSNKIIEFINNNILKEYPKIENHGVLFNNRTAALVSNNGEIDWACFPNFDSDPVFFSILDRKKGGFFAIFPLLDDFISYHRYEEDTNVLITEFYKGNSLILRILDFLPASKYSNIYYSEIHRYVYALEDLKIGIAFSPFERNKNKKIILGKFGGLIFYKKSCMGLSTDIKLNVYNDCLLSMHPMKMGESRWFVSYYGIKKLYPLNAFKSNEKLRETRKYWLEWISKSKYSGTYNELVNRSLLTLKGLFFEPTNFMVAAPTLSLPESLGGDRNWDYRFTWIRDTAYVIDVMCKFGYLDEATSFLYGIIDKIEKEKKVRSVYSVSGKKLIKEKVLDLEGYLNSKPVRFGNAAKDQLQIDQYGALIHAVYIFVNNGGEINLHIVEKIKDVITMIMKIWKKPDHSIWEIRGEPHHYVYSKVVAWSALNDMKKLIGILELNDINFIRKIDYVMNEIRNSIEINGVSKRGNYYTQYYGSENVDASLLRLPLIDYCNIFEQRYLNTFREIEKRLMKEDFLFLRYDSDDGFNSKDNAFLLITFWYIQNLILMNNIRRAKEGLIKIIKIMNSIGLLPEEIEFKTYRYLGNYPQALSHLSFLSTILSIEPNSIL